MLPRCVQVADVAEPATTRGVLFADAGEWRFRAEVDIALSRAIMLPIWYLKTMLEVPEERRQHQMRSLSGWITFKLKVYLKQLKLQSRKRWVP